MKLLPGIGLSLYLLLWSCDAPNGHQSLEETRPDFPEALLPPGWQVMAFSPLGRTGQNGFNRMEAQELIITRDSIKLNYRESCQELTSERSMEKKAFAKWVSLEQPLALQSEFWSKPVQKAAHSGNPDGKMGLLHPPPVDSMFEIREWIPEGQWESYQQLIFKTTGNQEWHTGLSVPLSQYSLSAPRLVGQSVWVCLNPQRSVKGRPHRIFILRCSLP
jgi:hypothetical protein